MKIILLQDIENIGRAGEVTQVRDGYFRNFLMPRKLAVLSDETSLRFLEARKKESAQKSAREKEKAAQVAAGLEKLNCLIKAKVGPEGKLFGAVTSHDVEEALRKQGFDIDRKRIELAPIHQVGEYHAKIKLHAEVSVNLAVSVKG